MDVKDVLIVGAGIGGLAAATALRQAGFGAHVVEVQPDEHSSVTGVGIIQAPNQLRALEAIGCAEACMAQGYGAANYSALYDQQGNLVRTTPGTPIPGVAFPPMNGITRPRLHRILTSRALEVGATISYDTTFTSLTQADDRVEVAFSDGTARSYDLVVGADGVRSAVRSYVLGPRWQPTPTGKSVFRINIPRLPEMDAIVAQIGHDADGERIGVGMVPLAPDLGYLYLNLPWDHTVRPSQPELHRIMAEKLAGFGGPAGVVRDEYLLPEQEVVLRPEEWLIADRPWHRGRIVLIGDAVHAVTPNTAQGAAQAIEDGLVLAETLSSARTVDEALSDYAERRYERCRMVVEYGYKSRQKEFDPSMDFDVAAMRDRMREALVAPI